jgi:uncharacterized protein YpuA (DUF1002 family)
MDKSNIESLIKEINQVSEQLPKEMMQKVSKLEQSVARMNVNEAQFAVATDHVVNEPASEQTLSDDDPGTLVSELFSDLNKFVSDHRKDGLEDEVISVLHRLRGTIGAYERDFP